MGTVYTVFIYHIYCIPGILYILSPRIADGKGNVAVGSRASVETPHHAKVRSFFPP